jgi:ABC-type multidrug transport system permease subunit
MTLISGAKRRVNIVQEMGFFFFYMIVSPITYIFQFFASTQYDDKENLFVTSQVNQTRP